MKILLIINIFFMAITMSVAAQPAKLYIDPENAMGGTASQIFDEVKYTPLETSKESLFGEIDQMVVTDKYFIIWDHYTNAILLFDRKGKFHSKIAGGKKSIREFSYDREKQSIVIALFDEESVMANPEILKSLQKMDLIQIVKIAHKYTERKTYDLDGKFLSAIDYKNTGLTGIAPQKMNSNYSVLFEALASSTFPDSVLHQLSVFKGDKIYKRYFPYNMKKDFAMFGALGGIGGREGLTPSANDTTFYLTRRFDNIIYQLSPNNLVPVYQLILPLSNTIAKEYFSDSVSTEAQRTEYLQKHKGWITSIQTVRATGDLLSFSLYYIGAECVNLIYGLKTGSLYDFNRISPDSSNGFLPLRKLDKTDLFCTCEGSNFYFGISSLDMFQAMETTKDKQPVYPDNLKEYFKNENRKSNPVVVQFRPKQNL